MTSFKDSDSPGYRPAVAADFPDGKYVPGYFVKLETTKRKRGKRGKRSLQSAADKKAKDRAKREAKYGKIDT